MCKENFRKIYDIENTNQNKYTNSERIKKRKTGCQNNDCGKENKKGTDLERQRENPN